MVIGPGLRGRLAAAACLAHGVVIGLARARNQRRLRGMGRTVRVVPSQEGERGLREVRESVEADEASEAGAEGFVSTGAFEEFGVDAFEDAACRDGGVLRA